MKNYYYVKSNDNWKIISVTTEDDGERTEDWVATVSTVTVAIALTDWLNGSHVLVEVSHK